MKGRFNRNNFELLEKQINSLNECLLPKALVIQTMADPEYCLISGKNQFKTGKIVHGFENL
jgi:hypothetical protein